MPNKKELVEQTKLAFDFIHKLYHETSYLIKEIEGMLSEEEEGFIIARPAGYNVSARSSTGLDPNYVNYWLLRHFSVAYLPESKTNVVRGQTITEIRKNFKALYCRLILDGEDIEEPLVYIGVLYDIQKKPNAKWIKKFENIPAHLECNTQRVFRDKNNINYEDTYLKLKGKFVGVKLYSLNNSEAIAKKLLDPALKLYRSI